MIHAAIAVVLSLVLQAQTPVAGSRPDFSGRWTDVSAAPAQAGQARQAAPGGRAGAPPATTGGRGDMGSGWMTPFTITQTATHLTVEYAFFSRGDMQPPLKHVFALNGSETQNTYTMGRGPQVQVTSASWDGDKLILKTRHTFSDPSTNKPMTMDVIQTLSLESPTTLVVETARSGVLGGQPTSTKVTYQKN